MPGIELKIKKVSLKYGICIKSGFLLKLNVQMCIYYRI